MRCGRPLAKILATDPQTPEEERIADAHIRRECAAIRATWGPRETFHRSYPGGIERRAGMVPVWRDRLTGDCHQALTLGVAGVADMAAAASD